MNAPTSQRELEDAIFADLASFEFDPLGYVMWAYPWGEGELEGLKGPRKWQRKFLIELGQELKRGVAVSEVVRKAVASGHGPGKAQPHSLEIDTPDGRRRWGDLQVGDRLFGTDGSPVRVVATHEQGVVDVYRVGFDDRSSTLCCGDHLWSVRGRQERRRKSVAWRTLSTKEIASIGVFRKNGTAFARQWEVPQQGAVQYPGRVIEIDPYTLGAWLGDGGRNSARITNADEEVIERLRSANSIHVGGKSGTGAKSIGVHGLKAPLRRLGLLDKYSFEKSVPREYMENSIEVRAEVLRGLLDTDGDVATDGCAGFSTTSPQLARDVVWLVRSLGGKARIACAVRKPFYRGPHGERLDGRPCWRVTLAMPHGFRLFYIERKQNRVKKFENRYLSRWIDSIEPSGRERAMCVTVSAADGLYQTNDFIVTHNSTLVAWVVDWAMSTREDTRGVVTASTDTQLRTKTWPEIAKWTRLALNSFMFVVTATAIYSADKGREKTWRIDIVPWSENNTEAFAGLHNKGKRLILLFDEASAIVDKIWEVAEGALTDENTQIMWLAFGNPTKNTGRFRECFGRFRHRWTKLNLDTRTVEGVNQKQIEQWLNDWGEDSDFFKVRVRGEFPSMGDKQFISSAVAEEARRRDAHSHHNDCVIFGVDVARFGDDQSVIAVRKGRDARTSPWKYYRGLDTMQLAHRVVELAEQLKPDAIFIDAGGVGGGVVDRCRQLGLDVIEVQFGGKPDRGSLADAGADGEKYANKRAEMWATMRQWLRGGAIPDSADLQDELCGPEYGYNNRDEILLESKDDMRKRGLASPDGGDALALTFAYPVARKVPASIQAMRGSGNIGDYDPHA